MFQWNIFHRNIFSLNIFGNSFLGDYFLKIRKVNAVIRRIFFCFGLALKGRHTAVFINVHISFFCCCFFNLGNIVRLCGFRCHIHTICGRVKKLIALIVEHFTNHIHTAEAHNFACAVIADIYKSISVSHSFIACTVKLVYDVGVANIFNHTIDHFRIFSSAYGNSSRVRKYSARKSYACITRQKICNL